MRGKLTAHKRFTDMSAPLLSRPTTAEQIRREIRVLQEEVNQSRQKRDGIARAIAERQTKISRLQAQLALIAQPGPILSCSLCSA